MNLKTKKTILLIVFVASIVTIVGTVSYAYFTSSGIINKQEATIETGTIKVRFSDNDPSLIANKIEFGKSITKKFTIENYGSLDATIRLDWIDLYNTYGEGSLTYSYSYSTSLNGEYTEVIKNRNVPVTEIPDNKVLLDSLKIPSKTTYYCNLVITLNHLSDIDQTSDLDATFQTRFSASDITNELQGASIMELHSSFYIDDMRGPQIYDDKIEVGRKNIEKIVFENKISEKNGAIESYDLSQNGDRSVMGYVVPIEEGTTESGTYYTLYIQGNGRVIAPQNSSGLFIAFESLKAIEGLEYFDTEYISDMSYMFCDSGITSLDLSSFDTSNVTNMSYMFYQCPSLTSLDLSSFNTSNVTNMSYMFEGCSCLTSLDLSGFNTSNVTNMSYMFYQCPSLTSLDLSSFNTSNVTNMSEMFYYCSSLTSLDLSSFNTSNVIYMNSMFEGCSSLTSLNLSSFNTSNVTGMGSMFNGCSSLTSLNLSSFDTSNVTSMNYMFNGCSSLTSLDLSSFNTSNVNDMASMFRSCSSLTSLNLSKFSISSKPYYNGFLEGTIPSTIQITVPNDTVKQWIIKIKSSLNDSNFIVLNA